MVASQSREPSEAGGPNEGAGYWDRVAAMVRRDPPEDCCVVPGTTPVVAFGEPRMAEVATLAINPSSREFMTRTRMLTGLGRSSVWRPWSPSGSRGEDLSMSQ